MTEVDEKCIQSMVEIEGWGSVVKALDEAVAAEREACAKVAEDHHSSGENEDEWTITRDVIARKIAAKIRERK